MDLGFGAALRGFWNIRGHWSEGRLLLEQALAASEGTASAVRAKALAAAASLAVYRGDMDRGEALCQDSLAQSRERGDTAGTAFSLYLLSTLAYMRGELATARSLMEGTLALERKLGAMEDIAYDLSYLAAQASLHSGYTTTPSTFD